jgi:hypothetical protein
MLRLKILSLFSIMAAVLAISATSAMAEFESKASPKQTQGKINILKEGNFEINGAFPVKCPKAEIKAIYRIQQKGQIKQQQLPSTSGPHLEIQVKSWGNNCTTNVLGTEVPTTVNACNLVLEQRQKTEAAGGVVTPCGIAIGTLCKIQIPAGMETAANSGQGINVGLTTVTLSNSGNNGIAKANINGGGRGQIGGGKIFANQSGSTCPEDSKLKQKTSTPKPHSLDN